MSERTKPLEKRFDKLGPRVAEALKRRHFEAYYCPTRQEAAKQALELIPEGSVVAWGGSETVAQLGILDTVRKTNPVIDRDTASTQEEKIELMRKSLLCDVYLMSSNAISEDGQLFNIDGNGNRVAALVFGPKNVIIVAGMNKVTSNIDTAIERARYIAAPTNAQRFSVQTACMSTGTCGDCLSPSSVCASMLRTRICRPAGRIKVILVGEELGF
ncbi:MAG: lactate utilization protein [Lachnospiraceae bacterium]|nr:lactate utilization protein [Lachnospiraceae bacterium]